MPQITIPVAADALQAASDQLGREIERLEVTGKQISKIHYPPRFADKLGIAQAHNSALYRGHPASVRNVVPYEIVIDYDD